MYSTKKAAAAVMVVFVVLIGAAGATAFSFSSPKTIGSAGESRGFPRIAVDSEGRGAVVWHNYERRNGRIEAVRIDGSGGVGSPKVLSDPAFDANNAEIGIDGNGRAVIVWEAARNDANLIQLTSQEVDGSQGPVVNLPGDGSEPEIAVNSEGVAIVAWQRYSDNGAELAALQVRPDGSPGAVVSLYDGMDPTGEGKIDVSIDASGRGTVMWQATPRNRRNPIIFAARLENSTVILRPRPLSNPKRVSYLGNVPTDDAGNSTVVWSQYSGAVKAVRLSSDGRQGKVRTLSGRGPNSGVWAVVDDSGRVTAAWSTGQALVWTRLAPNGVPGRKRKLRGAGIRDMAADDSGRVWIAWNQTRPLKPGGYYSGSIKAVRLSADGTAGRVETLTKPNEDTYDFQGYTRPDLAVSGAGTASVVWPDLAGRNARIRLVRSIPLP